jgi:hypothetical protein
MVMAITERTSLLRKRVNFPAEKFYNIRLRFLETVEGAIFVDGDDISKRNLFTHRTSINIIPQVPFFYLEARPIPGDGVASPLNF